MLAVEKDAAVIEFHVPGLPQPQGSKRAYLTASGKVNLVESAAGVRPWRSDVKVFAAEQMAGRPMLAGPLRVRCDFVLRRPVSTPKTRPTPAAVKKPDVDKLLRAVLDSMTGTVYADDSTIVELIGTKRLAEDGEQPGVTIKVSAS